jgi:hypothetical protein
MNAINAVTLPGAPLPALPAAWIPPGEVNPTSTPYVAAISNSGAAAGPMGGTTSSRAGEGPIIMFGGTADTVVNYANWQIRTCDQHKAKGNICEFVATPGPITPSRPTPRASSTAPPPSSTSTCSRREGN